jgi:hypothetical protein
MNRGKNAHTLRTKKKERKKKKKPPKSQKSSETGSKQKMVKEVERKSGRNKNPTHIIHTYIPW